MKKKAVVAFVTLIIIGAGMVFAVGNGYFQFYDSTMVETEKSAIPASDNLAESSVDQAQEIERLRLEVERLREELVDHTLGATSESSTPSDPEVVPISELPPFPLSEPSVASENVLSSSAPMPKENAGTVFEGYIVTVTDSETVAVRAAGTDWPISKYYFISENGDYLGSISGQAMNSIIEKYQVKSTGDAPGASGEWEFWFAEKFNAYRGIDGLSENTSTEDGYEDITTNSSKSSDFDAFSLASEAFDLINQERARAGLDEVEMDSDWMDLAEMRAVELPEKYDHVRPDGTRMSAEYKCAEIINRRAQAASIAVSSWMGSSGHKDIILSEKYKYAGIGCYQDESGTTYWCMLFSK